jgi:tetratricopeptide (TPR) repeat protein
MSEKATEDEISYKDALAAAPRLRSLYDDDVYLKIPSEYSATKADVAAKSAEVPTDADGYVQKGQILGSSGRFDEAIAAFSKALAITPDNSAALIGRAMALMAKGDSKGAEQDAATVEKLHPGEASAAALRGYVQLQQGEFTEAEASLTEALRARPDDTYMRLLRGQTRVQLNKGDDALSDFNAILAREPSNMSALAGRAAAYHAVGQNDRALADSDQVLKMGKADPRLRLLRANIFRDEGKHDLVVKEAELLMQENPDSDFALVAAGKIFSAEGFRDKAMRALTGALSVNRYAYIYINRAEVRAPSDYAGKMADLDEALKLEPKSPDALAAKARLLSKQRQYSQALDLYDQAIAAAPDGGDTLKVERAIALYKSGRTADAKKALDEARAKATTALALNNLCWMEATADILLDSAVQSCRDALKLRPDSAGYTDSLGMVLLRLGKLDEAIQAYGRAIDKAHLASSYMGRAIAYARLGDTARAQADKAEALKLNADIEAQFGGYGLEISGDQKSRVIK